MTTKIEKEIVYDWNNNIETPITKYLKSLGLKGQAVHLGMDHFTPVPEWYKYNKQKSYPKTDIIIGKYKISLKTKNEHIIMAAKKNEVIATFMNVANNLYDGKVPELVNNVIKEMDKMVTTAVSPTTILKAKKERNPDIMDAYKKHAEILDMIEYLFKEPVFQTAFIKEALTGELKFGKNSDACATHILNTEKSPVLYSLNDMNYISKVARDVEIRVSFKSTVKMQGKEVGQYRYWSILSMISKEILKDSVIYENSFMSKSISYILSILSSIKSTLTNLADIFNFLGVEPEIIIIEK